MSVIDSARAATGHTTYATSPFAAAALCRARLASRATVQGTGGPPAGSSISSPFAEALASYDESQLEAETFEALRAEFEDEDFVPALQALADEVAARHLSGAGTWSESEQGMQLSAAEAEQWMEAVADRGGPAARGAGDALRATAGRVARPRWRDGRRAPVAEAWSRSERFLGRCS